MNNIAVLIAIPIAVAQAVVYIDYVQIKDEYKKLKSEFDKQTELKKSYLNEVKSLHQLDTKRTQELNNAKAEIRKLSDDLHNGTKRLYAKAVCAKSDSTTTSSASMDDARPAKLAGDAERNYLRLRRQLETLEAQFLGLRERVREIYKQNGK